MSSFTPAEVKAITEAARLADQLRAGEAVDIGLGRAPGPGRVRGHRASARQGRAGVTLLDEVCWPAVLDALLASTPELPGDLTLYLGPHELLSPRHRLLAVCAFQAGPQRCAAAVGEAAGRWLCDTARTAHLTLAPVAHRSVFPRFTGWVLKDPMLPGLPLLGLAAAHAERAQRTLLVIGADLGILAGCCTRRAEVTIGGRPTVATLVELSKATPMVWCHELAHAVDPAERDPVASEAFADTLGALLLIEQPGNLAELDALITLTGKQIAQAAVQRPGSSAVPTPTGTGQSTDDGELPAPGVDALLAFAGLDLRAWMPTR